MIQEIINFVDTLPQEVFTKNLQPREGLYILLDIDENGKLLNVDEEGKVKEEDIGFYSKKDEKVVDVVEKCLPLQLNSKVLNPNKSYNSTQKLFISLGSPFGIGFKKQNFEKAIIQKYEAALTQYFGNTAAKSFFDLEDEEQLEKHNRLERFCKGQLWNFINQLEEFKTLKKTFEVFIFLKGIDVEWFKSAQEQYLAKRLWNDEKYSKSVNDESFGISDSLSHFNDKKPYLKHFTATNKLNFRVNGASAVSLYKFFNLQRNKQIPNPLPIFIDKEELTEKAVKIFNDEKGKLGYVELIKRLLENGDDLSNYYLIFFDVRAKKSKVIDIDFVPNFRYEMSDVKIVEIFSLNGHFEAKTKIKTVFDFEYKIINEMFNRKLMPKEGWRRYFDEMEAHRMSANTYNQLMKYRRAIYDYVFKSRRQAITKTMFNDIMLKGILDDIRLDDNGSNDYSIKAKLNIWFSLYEYFDYTQFNKPLNKKSMVNKTEELISRISTVATNEENHLRNDDEFAFAAGQIIHYLLNKSEAGNRTHALLEPFLQKTNATLLKREIARCFDMYKHAIKFYARKYEFDKIMSEVMGYEPDEANMKNLLPSTLAGYFAKSTFSKKTV
ncbi:MAG: CRISPR-associated protein Csh1 [Saprospiraceae bacterium]|jgi:CRISPR-associated protein Csh1